MFGFGKAKKEAWKGVVARKGQGSNIDDEGKRSVYYTLDVRRDDNGKNQHYVVGRGQVSLELFQSVVEGDRVSKAAGTKQLQKE